MKLGRFIGARPELAQGQRGGNRVRRNPLLRVIATITLCGILITPGIPFTSGKVASAVGSTPLRPTNFSGSCTDANDSWGQMSLTFTPGSENGSPITNYKYSFDNVSFTAFNPATTTQPFVFNFTTLNLPTPTVSIYLKAVNANGDGESSYGNPSGTNSAASCTFLNPGLPRAPTTATATAGDGSASIEFTRGSNGGSAITNYKYSIDGGVTYIALNPANATSPLTIPGLTNGVLTTIKLIAVNANGQTPSSYARTVTVTPASSTTTTTVASTTTTTVAPASTTTVVPTTTTTVAPATTVASTTTTTTVAPPKPSSPTVLECKTVVSSKISTAPVLVGEKLSNGIIFDPASPILDSRDKQELDRVARVMDQRGGLVLISGFARKNGFDSAEYLRNLSLARARNVSGYLVAKGIRVSMRYEGYGAVTKDIGTSIERKVELRWIDDSEKIEYEKKCLNQ
jgi:outer membrane protein OmpA-like peptidoglycan-associated protein